jgi:hypothetical protein
VAATGTGYRSVLSMMIELSFHLVESILYSTLTTAVAAPGSTTVVVGSLGTPKNALYVGAQIVIDFGTANQEVVAVTNVNESASAFTAVFTFAHAIGATVIGATFPTQATSGDYFFSQSEILGYLARAQNEFLAQVPCIFSLNTQFVQFGQIYQQLVCDAIEMHRVASSSKYIALTSLTRTSGTVTAVSQSPHGLSQGSKFSIYNASDPSFTGAFKVGTVIGPDSWSYPQDQPDGSATDGAAVLWLRLYETSQEELSIQDPFWRNQNLSKLSSWYEDRTGNYKWGVNGKPASQFPVEVLVSQRDTDTLAMTDYFLVPDVTLHAVKYKALSYCWGKDGEARDQLRQKYSEMRFDRLILATRRWMDGMIGEQSTKAARRG